MTRPDANPKVVQGLHQLEGALAEAHKKGDQDLVELIANDLGPLVVSLHPEIIADAIEGQQTE